ncbi:UNVERIFIED_CONTAM: hypothetical protein FKN15_077155 [Acipenser sinensis]
MQPQAMRSDRQPQAMPDRHPWAKRGRHPWAKRGRESGQAGVQVLALFSASAAGRFFPVLRQHLVLVLLVKGEAAPAPLPLMVMEAEAAPAALLLVVEVAEGHKSAMDPFPNLYFGAFARRKRISLNRFTQRARTVARGSMN